MMNLPKIIAMIALFPSSARPASALAASAFIPAASRSRPVALLSSSRSNRRRPPPSRYNGCSASSRSQESETSDGACTSVVGDGNGKANGDESTSSDGTAGSSHGDGQSTAAPKQQSHRDDGANAAQRSIRKELAMEDADVVASRIGEDNVRAFMESGVAGIPASQTSYDVKCVHAHVAGE